MAKTRIGLDIGSTAVRVAEVQQGDRPSVVRLGQVPLPLGAVEAGEVQRPDQVGAALERLMQVSGIKGREVYMGMANAKVVAREISLPYLPEKELRSALGFQVQEFIPMPPEDAIMDFELLDQTEVDGQKLQNMLLVAAPRQSVAAHVEAAERGGLIPLGIDFAPLAAVRATSGDDAAGAEALVDIGGHITYIALHRGTSVRLVRVLNNAGRDVTQAIARSLGVEPGVAELLKRGETDPMGIEGLDREKAREAASEAAAPLVQEIASTIEFSLRQTPDLQVSRIVMTGGGSHLEGIVELLDARMPLPVERAKVFGRARSRLVPELGAMVEAGRTFSVAIGLALPDVRESRGGRAA